MIEMEFNSDLNFSICQKIDKEIFRIDESICDDVVHELHDRFKSEQIQKIWIGLSRQMGWQLLDSFNNTELL